MPTLLHLNVSPRGDYSVSRQLTKAVVEDWKKNNAGGKVIYRDLSENPLPFVDLPWIAAAYSTPDQHTPEQQAAISVSSELVDELLAVDEIVIGTPMYNFTVPAALKGWIDHIVRLGRTFNTKYEGLAAGKKARIVMASGSSYEPGAYLEQANFFSSYIRFVLGFVGIKDVEIYLAGGTSAISQGKPPSTHMLPSTLQGQSRNYPGNWWPPRLSGGRSDGAVPLWRGLMTLYYEELPRTGLGTRTQVTSS